jgi:hypothetical protein
LERPKILRYTNEDQQRLHPGDKFFEYQADLVDRDFNWGPK